MLATILFAAYTISGSSPESLDNGLLARTVVRILENRKMAEVTLRSGDADVLVTYVTDRQNEKRLSITLRFEYTTCTVTDLGADGSVNFGRIVRDHVLERHMDLQAEIGSQHQAYWQEYYLNILYFILDRLHDRAS